MSAVTKTYMDYSHIGTLIKQWNVIWVFEHCPCVLVFLLLASFLHPAILGLDPSCFASETSLDI